MTIFYKSSKILDLICHQNIPKSNFITPIGLKKQKITTYRTRATIGRSQLVAADLCFQAKKYLLCAFYMITCEPENLFLN